MHMEELCFEEMYNRERNTSLCKKAPRMLRSHPILVEEGGRIRNKILKLRFVTPALEEKVLFSSDRKKE